MVSSFSRDFFCLGFSKKLIKLLTGFMNIRILWISCMMLVEHLADSLPALVADPNWKSVQDLS